MTITGNVALIGSLIPRDTNQTLSSGDEITRDEVFIAFTTHTVKYSSILYLNTGRNVESPALPNVGRIGGNRRIDERWRCSSLPGSGGNS